MPDGRNLAIETEGIRCVFGDSRGVHNVDLSVRVGEVHALVGLNGAGKTTLMRLMLAMLPAEAGTVRVFGDHAHSASPVTWSRVGHMIDQPFAYPELTVDENLRLAFALQRKDRTEAAMLATQVTEALGIAEFCDVKARELSSGNRQRLGLAAALGHSPELVVLDEPTNALDPRAVVQLREVLLDRARSGTAVLVSSHHLDEVARIADRITVINRGRVVGELEPGGSGIERQFFDMVLEHDEVFGR